jgi:peptidoglycan/xylan/chitin deacetylase (PgdA/CDA1 family)
MCGYGVIRYARRETVKGLCIGLIALLSLLMVPFGLLWTAGPAVAADLVPNNSVEQASGGAPVNWHQNYWGTNTPTFEYVNEGHTGSKSLKVTVSGWQDGDAKWYFDPQPLAGDQSYMFSVWYKTNAVLHTVAVLVHGDGSQEYVNMPDAEPDGTAGWQFYNGTFYVPANVTAVTMYFFLSQNGWLQTDDYHMETYEPVGFDRPLVSITVDDSYEQNVSTLLPALNALGIKGTQFVATTYCEGIPSQEAFVKQFQDSGWEIGSHSVTHPDLTTVSADQLDYELKHSQEYLEGLTGGPVNDFATPYGNYNKTVLDAIRLYYGSHRPTDEGYNSRDNFDPYVVQVKNMQSNTTLADFQSWLDTAIKEHTWLVLVYHKVTDDSPGPWDTTIEDFNAQVSALVSSGVTIKRYEDALAEVEPVANMPLIHEVVPGNSPAGSTVQIDGHNFGAQTGTSTVTFNGVAVTAYSSWSDSGISVAVPKGASSGPLLVTSSSGVSNPRDFTVNNIHVDSISPTSANQGSTVTIKGQWFGASRGAYGKVMFGKVASTGYSSWSDSQIKAVVPAGASGEAKVTVVNAYGASNAASFKVVPRVTSISPASGPSGTMITLRGSGFGGRAPASCVRFYWTSGPVIKSVRSGVATSWADNKVAVHVIIPAGQVKATVLVVTSAGASNYVWFSKR